MVIKMNEVPILFIAILGICYGLERGEFLACYKDKLGARLFVSNGSFTSKQCVHMCEMNYYRYALNQETVCKCSNYLGEEYNNTHCIDTCKDCDLKLILNDVYFTGNLVPGPPRRLTIKNVTETTAYISWHEPDSFVDIQSYQVKSMVLHTYSSILLSNIRRLYSNNTYDAELVGLQPATKYNITVQAVSVDGEGAITSEMIDTVIGDPDNAPSQPLVVRRQGKTMIVKLDSVINNNGPVTSYRIGVVNEDAKQVLVLENLKQYRDANNEGYSYYITAELQSKDIERNFTIGDGNYYGPYYNAPLEPNVKYQPILGLVSLYSGKQKIVYSNITKPEQEIIVVQAPEEFEGDSPVLIVGLTVATVLFGLLLIVGTIGFMIFKNRMTNRRRRLTDHQELTMQGPIIEIENTGFIPEEEITPVNHYANLKQQVWSIPRTALKVESNKIGAGKFGPVNTGSVIKDSSILPVGVYTIADRKLTQEIKRNMLKDLDVLIRAGQHKHLISLVGTCETPENVFVVIDYASTNLKDLLLGSRDALPGRFSNMSESQALNIAVGICEGMEHLESHKIIHKQLCARNILVTSGLVAKVSGYGLAQYYNPNLVPDYTRWLSTEVLRGQPYTIKSDVWAFACLLWEICVLGGTPYGSVPNNEIPDRVVRGLRLVQLPYISDELYQIMLDCWQLDSSERPTFTDLVTSLHSIMADKLISHLNFNMYSGFQYEQFYLDMELAARTIF